MSQFLEDRSCMIALPLEMIKGRVSWLCDWFKCELFNPAHPLILVLFKLLSGIVAFLAMLTFISWVAAKFDCLYSWSYLWAGKFILLIIEPPPELIGLINSYCSFKTIGIDFYDALYFIIILLFGGITF